MLLGPILSNTLGPRIYDNPIQCQQQLVLYDLRAGPTGSFRDQARYRYILINHNTMVLPDPEEENLAVYRVSF